MAKIALMIGISEYGSGLNPLPSALNDIEAIQQVLQPLERAGFDEVKCLANPNPPMMREAIETLFDNRQKDDLVLLFFSGHVVQDNHKKLYFSTSVTCKTSRPELIRVSTIPASFVLDLMNNSECKQIVLILDCCFDNSSLEEILSNNPDFFDIKAELGGEGRAILSCFSLNKKSWEQEEIDSDYSIYTSYLVEGMKTGIADLNDDGWIAVDELHQYANNKLQIVAPTLKPEFYAIEQASDILLLSAPTDDPKLQYRQEVEKWISFGNIPQASHYILDKLSVSLSLNSEDCQAIKKAVIKPYQEYQEKLQIYQKEYEKAINNANYLDDKKRERLSSIQQFLGLKNEDVALIEEQVTLNIDQTVIQSELDIFSHNSNDVIDSIPLAPEIEPTFSGQNSIEQSVAVSDDSVISPEIEPKIFGQDYIEQPIAISDEEKVISSEVESTISGEDKIDVEEPDNLIINSPTIINSHPLPPSLIVSETSINPNIEFVEKDSRNNSSKASHFPYKFIIPIGILAAVGLVIAFSNRNQITPLPVPNMTPTTTSEKPSSPIISPTPTPTISPTPSPSTSPESKVCTIFVNGNLRAEPTYFRTNIVEALREPVLVTGKQTKAGWIQVKMPNDKLAWAYQDIISEKDRREMNDCLIKNKITINLIEDLLPPSSMPSP